MCSMRISHPVVLLSMTSSHITACLSVLPSQKLHTFMLSVTLTSTSAFRYRVVAFDMRGHGETTSSDDLDLSSNTLAAVGMPTILHGSNIPLPLFIGLNAHSWVPLGDSALQSEQRGTPEDLLKQSALNAKLINLVCRMLWRCGKQCWARRGRPQCLWGTAWAARSPPGQPTGRCASASCPPCCPAVSAAKSMSAWL